MWEQNIFSEAWVGINWFNRLSYFNIRGSFEIVHRALSCVVGPMCQAGRPGWFPQRETCCRIPLVRRKSEEAVCENWEDQRPSYIEGRFQWPWHMSSQRGESWLSLSNGQRKLFCRHQALLILKSLVEEWYFCLRDQYFLKPGHIFLAVIIFDTQAASFIINCPLSPHIWLPPSLPLNIFFFFFFIIRCSQCQVFLSSLKHRFSEVQLRWETTDLMMSWNRGLW